MYNSKIYLLHYTYTGARTRALSMTVRPLWKFKSGLKWALGGAIGNTLTTIMWGKRPLLFLWRASGGPPPCASLLRKCRKLWPDGIYWPMAKHQTDPVLAAERGRGFTDERMTEREREKEDRLLQIERKKQRTKRTGLDGSTGFLEPVLPFSFISTFMCVTVKYTYTKN